MKKIILLISILMTLNVYANSKWVRVAEDESGNEYFFDANSVQKSGNSITFWQRKNNKVRDKKGVLSWKVQLTINCRNRDSAFRYFMNFDDLDNNGKVLMNSVADDTSWKPIPPDSIAWSFYEFVCK